MHTGLAVSVTFVLSVTDVLGRVPVRVLCVRTDCACTVCQSPPAAQRRLMVTTLGSFERLGRTFACSERVGESDLRMVPCVESREKQGTIILSAPLTCSSPVFRHLHVVPPNFKIFELN